MTPPLAGVRLGAYGCAYFFASGAFMSYWPVWLRDRGVADAEIGTLFMGRQIVSVAATLLIGWLAHRLAGTRGLIAALGAAAALLMGLYEFAFGFAAILAVTLVWGTIWAPTMALYDGVVVPECKRLGFVYGRVRVWGSVAFIAGAFLCGLAVDRHGPAWTLYVGMAGILLLCPLALLLPVATTEPRAPGAAPTFGARDLLRQPAFLLFLAATGLCQASHAVLYSFGTLTWRDAGIDDVTISLLWAESVAIEIVLMLASGWLLLRLGVCGLIAFGLGCALVRWGAMAFTADLPALVILQALHAGSFAAAHLGAMAFLQRAVPAEGASLGQSLYYALGTGLTQAVMFQIAGLLYAEFAARAFLGMAVVALAGLVAIAALARRWDGSSLVGPPQK